MPKRDRSERLALAALAIIVFGVVLVTAFGTLEQAQRRACEQPSKGCDTGGNNQPYNGWRDSFAQWAMMGFAGAGIGVGLWTILLLQRTIYETRLGNRINKRAGERQVREARRIGEAQIRAYLTCAGGEYWLNAERLTLDIWIKNAGQSPAVRVAAAGAHLDCFLSKGERAKGRLRAIYPSGPVASGATEKLHLIMGSGMPKNAETLKALLASTNPILGFLCKVEWEDVFGRTSTIYLELISDPLTDDVTSNDHPSHGGRHGNLVPESRDANWAAQEYADREYP